MSIISVLYSLPAAGQEPSPTPMAQATPLEGEKKSLHYLELSVHGEGKATKRILFKDKRGKFSAYNLDKPFSLEWVPIPEDTVGFVVVPTSMKTVDGQIDLIPIGNLPSDASLYLRLPPPRDESGILDNKYNLAEKALSVKTNLKPGTKGWTYVGSWSPTTKEWALMYWLDSVKEPAEIGKRSKFWQPPNEIINKELVADFPMYLRESPNGATSEEKLIRPGRVVRVDDITVDVSGRRYEVWAKVTISK